MRRILATCGALALLFACAREGPPPPTSLPPNVVLVVANGFGTGAWSLTRLVADAEGQALALDAAESVAFLAPGSGERLVLDGRGAAEAWSLAGEAAARVALGRKLRDAGWSLGVATTARVTGDLAATLLCGGSEEPIRAAAREDSAAARLLTLEPRVLFGGGRRHFLPRAEKGLRRDGRNLLAEAERAGWSIVDAVRDSVADGRPLLGLFADSRLPHELDRATEPDLAEMARAALRRLIAGSAPWFLLIEEGSLGAAARDHDAAGIAANARRLDRAIATVLEEIDRDRTLVLVVGGHATASPAVLADAHPESLSVVTASVERLEWRIFGGGFQGTPRELEEAALPALDQCARHTGLSSRDLDRLLTCSRRSERKTVLGTILSRRFGIAFLAPEDQRGDARGEGRTAELVPVRAWGPRAGELRGIRTHAELGGWLHEVLELGVPAGTIDTTGSAGVG